MPQLVILTATGTAQRQLLQETLDDLRQKGYPLEARQEGGEWLSLLSENLGGGLFSSRRAVLVEEASKLGPFPPQAERMLEEQSSCVVLVLVYEGDHEKFFPRALLPRISVKRATEVPRFGTSRMRWIVETGQSLGVRLTEEAVSFLAESLEDPEEIRAQIVKLAVAFGDKESVSLKEVRRLCLDDGSRNLLRLLDGLCRGETPLVLAALEDLRKKADLFPILTALHNRMRLAWYLALFSKESKEVLKVMGARPYAATQARKAVGLYGKEALSRFVIGLIGINIREKKGLGNGWSALTVLLMRLLESILE